MKKVLKIIRIIILFGILISVGFYFYIKNYWKNFTNETEVDKFISEIKSSEKLPENFYTLYEVENHKALSNDLNMQMLKAIFNSNFIQPPSSQASFMFIFFSGKNLYRHRYKMAKTSLAWKIEKRTSQRECLNWLTENYDFLNNAKGIKEASKLYFKKSIEELSERELASLVIMLENSSLYNPFRRQKLIDKRVQELLKKSKLLTEN